jgi:hypothetical protein
MTKCALIGAYRATILKLNVIRHLFALKLTVNSLRYLPYFAQSEDVNDTTVIMEGSDILLTPDQTVAILEMTQQSHDVGSDVTHVRRKRKTINAHTQLWNLPIFYKFDGSHCKFKNSMS